MHCIRGPEGSARPYLMTGESKVSIFEEMEVVYEFLACSLLIGDFPCFRRLSLQRNDAGGKQITGSYCTCWANKGCRFLSNYSKLYAKLEMGYCKLYLNGIL